MICYTTQWAKARYTLWYFSLLIYYICPNNHKNKKLMVCPFQYGTIANHDKFINRAELKAQIKDKLLSETNLILASPSKWGKTSLIKSVTNEIKASVPQMRICHINAFGIKNMTDLCLSIQKQFQQSIGKDAPDTSGWMPEEIFGNIETVLAEKNLRLIMWMTEFQQLTNIQDFGKIEKLLHSARKNQKNMVFCICGNNRYKMAEAFDTAKKPLNKFGQMIYVPRIDKTEWTKYITSLFKKSGKYITEQQADLICETTKCNPWYVQQLSFFIWTATTMDVDDYTIKQSIQQLIDTNSPMFRYSTENLTFAQIAMLKAVVCGENQFNAAKIVEKYNLGNAQTITRNKRALVERGFIDKTENSYFFCDPVFELWFKQELM